MSTSGGAAPLRLGPGWRKSGTGFQPPPAVPDREESRERSGSHASGGSGTGGGKDKNLNPFAMLDDEEDAGNGGNKNNGSSEPSSGGGGRFSNLKESDNRHPPKRGGRSLADLAKRVSDRGIDDNRRDSRRDPRNHDRPSSAGITRVRSGSGEGLGHGNYDRDRSASHGSSGGMEGSGAKVIRYTREKLLSLRGRGDDDIPDCLKALEDSVVVSKTSQDPVCWDTFDSDEIWASTAHRGDRRASDRGPPTGPSNRDDRGPPPNSRGSMDRGSMDRGPMDRGRSSGGGNSGFGSGRWQRGVAVPDKETRPDSRGRSGGGNNAPARDADDLWDDPTPTTGAASDFSAFGGSLEDDLPKGKSGMSGAFDLGDMSAAASAFESELHGDKASKKGSDTNGGIGGALEDEEEGVTHKVDSSRPLAGTGTTIRSGSGDGVNVFEDFGDDEEEEKDDDIPIKSGTGANSASSRLMGMIGVAGTGEASGSGAKTEPTTTTTDDNDAKKKSETEVQEETKPRSDSIPSNPWGAPAVSSNPWGDSAAAADSSSANKQKEEEEKRWADAQANQQAEKEKQEAAAKEAKAKAEQMKAQQIQVELVLIERISNILENSWGRSDLPSILSTLHANDSRVIAILSTVDALRQLIARHPLRIQMGRDPTMGAEMAALRMTNVQWKAHELREKKAQEQELQRQKQLQAEKEARAQMEAEERRKQQLQQQQSAPPVVTDAPWYYADPQGNIQGPFGGDEMRQWLEAGYFKGDLPISQNTNGPFLALNSYFSGDPSNAFKPADNGAAKAREAAEAKARAEAEQKAAEEQAAREKAEAKARALAEAEKNNQQSTQLKMMLGLGGGGSSSDGIAGPPQPEPIATSEPTPSQPTKKQQGTKKPSQKQKQSEPTFIAQAAPVPAPEPAAPPAPAWGGAKATAARQKSMSEIQQEEAREAARLAKERGTSGGSGSGWANIAATGGSTAWGGAAAKNTAAGVVTPTAAQPVASTQKSGGNNNAAWNAKKQSQAAGAAKKSSQSKAATSSKKTAVDNFGSNGQMTPSLEVWCKEQMKRLNGSDDLTLVQFCMTLTDKDEIRQYLTAYLGSTPQVNNFATEFTKKIGLDSGKEEPQWEGVSKKNKKVRGKK